ncbi:MAG: hypothetical protein Tsb0014_44180 [Pleurocapsa sp.]
MASNDNIRLATFNVSLNRSTPGELIADLSTPDDEQAQAVAEIIQRNNPDVILLNEFDYDSAGEAIALFQENYLNIPQNGADTVEYPYIYLAPSNTGIPSGFDLDNDGVTDGAGDAYGFGDFPGQYGMVLLSKYPIDGENVRTFQNFLWQDMPGALLPDDYYSEAELEVLRLSSKSHWDIPVEINGETVHILASHPTPPVFDGEEDRNGRRNHDEIRFWADYITPGEGDYIYDDNGNYGGLATDEKFVIVGDQNADPFDGDSTNNAIAQLLDNPFVNTSLTPSSQGGIDASDRTNNINDTHLGNPAFDTGDFNDESPGNLRVDYVLPSENIGINDAGVFWTTADDPLFDLIGDFDPDLLPVGYPSSDHRLVYVDANLTPENNNRQTVTDLEFLGEVSFETGFTFNETEVGGISGLTYDPASGVYYALSDDRSNINDARFYTIDIDLDDGSLDDGDVRFQDVTTLLNISSQAFTPSSLDPEGIALTSEGTLFISSEGDANNLVDPFIGEFSLNGQIFNELTIPDKFLPTADSSSGIQNNQAFESLTITPDQKYLFTATENSLFQDGEKSSLESGSLVRIVQYDRATEEVVGEFLYETDAIPVPPDPVDGFADNGLVELLAIDNRGTLLALERSFAEGVGNNIRLYQVNLQGATDVSSVEGLLNEDGELTDVDAIASKELLLDFSDLGITLDNSEAVSFGSTLPDGRHSLIVTSDNNFNDAQSTQFLAFAIDTKTIPTVTPVTETPDEIRFGNPDNPDPNNAPDADDPAIYVHPDNPENSFVITTFKNGGLRVYDLAGEEIQSITPENIRYNNVDLAYGVQYTNQLGETSTVDLAITSDRANDTLAIFAIDPDTRQLTDVTAFDIPETIFGVDDGEATAYGLATYTSVVDGKNYVFVSQADGNKVAQLEITARLGAADGLEVSAEVIRIIDVPVPEGEDAEEYQVEGMVVDRETGYLYLGQEDYGIWKYAAEPNDNSEPVLVDTVEGENLEADVEGLTIYYGEDGNGYLLASSQGDNTFAIYDRAGSNSYLGSFAVEGVEESDGADITSMPLGDNYPGGLLVVQDSSNTPQVVFGDPEDGEIQNFNTNFKYVSLTDLGETLPNLQIGKTEEPLDILLVNDDGYEAEGINLLYDDLVAAGYNVTLVAPKEQQSGKGTLINVDSVFQPTEVVEFEDNKWYVDGSPVVTTLAGLDYILEGDEPDLVISGINEGANVGEDIAISSGTVSAATTATRRGIPAIAVSAEGDEETIAEAYETGTEFVLDLIEELEATQTSGEELLPEGVGLNVNIPDNYSGGVALTQLDETSNINLSFGELPAGFGEGAGVLFNPNDLISPSEIDDSTSEGQNFLAGNITVTPIDGSWVADSSVREDIASRLLSDIGIGETTPLNILLTNDDGFDAEGIEVIYDTLTAAGHNVTLVAPKEQQSGTGTALDVDAILQPTEVVNYEENKWYVDAGVRTTTWAGLDYILDGETPDLIISGINEGENIGAGGAVSSGTVSAAVTGILRDVPAIAVSAGVDFSDPEGNSTSIAYAEGADYIVELIAQLQATQGEDSTILAQGTGLSINIPARFPEGVDSIQGVAFTEPDAIEPFIIDFGEVEGGVGLRFAPLELTEDMEIDPLSEGGQFLSGYITVTALDGDWTADSEEITGIGDRLDSLFVEPAKSGEYIVGTLDNDNLTINGKDNLIFTGAGNDAIDLTASQGNNRIYSGSGNDIFYLGTEVTDVIADFDLDKDVINISGISFDDLSLNSENNRTIISLSDQAIGVLVGVDAQDLTADNFSFV